MAEVSPGIAAISTELDEREKLRRFLNELVYAGVLSQENVEDILSTYDSASGDYLLTKAHGKKASTPDELESTSGDYLLTKAHGKKASTPDELESTKKLLLEPIKFLIDLANDEDKTVRDIFIKQRVAENKRKSDILGEFNKPYSGNPSNRGRYYNYLSNRLTTAQQLAASETDPEFRATLEGVVSDSQKLLNSTLEADVFTQNQTQRQEEADRIKAFEGDGGVGRGIEILAEEARAREVEPGVYKLPPLPPGQEEVDKFLGEFSPNLRDYFSNRLTEITDPIKKAREAWWNTVHSVERRIFEAEQEVKQTSGEYNAALAAKSRYNKEAASVYPWGTKPPDVIDEAGARSRYEKAVAKRQGILGGVEGGSIQNGVVNKGQPFPDDPLKAYLKEFPFMSKFLAVAPRRRGEFTRVSAPPAVWGSRY